MIYNIIYSFSHLLIAAYQDEHPASMDEYVIVLEEICDLVKNPQQPFPSFTLARLEQLQRRRYSYLADYIKTIKFHR